MPLNCGDLNDPTVVSDVKKCYGCDVIKPLSDFARKREKWDTRCKVCRNEKFRERYHRIRKAKRQYRSIPIHKVVDVPIRGSGTTGIAQKTVETILSDLVLDVFTEKYGYE